MNTLLLKLLNRVYQAPEDGDGGSNAGGGDSAPAAEGGGGSDDSSVDWGGLNANVDPGSDDAEEEGSEPSASKASENPAGKTKEGEPAPDSTLEEDPANPNPENVENALAPVDSDQPELTPEQIAEQEKQFKEDFTKWKQAETARLTEVYSFDEETASRLQTEPELVLPEIAARLHLEVVQHALESVQRMLPSVVPQLLQTQNAEKTAVDMFYSVNPDLKKYHKQVIQVGQMYRKLNPKASPEVAAKKIGELVRNSLALEPLAPGAQGKQPVAAKPAARTAPHKPAMPGSGGGVKHAPVKEDAGFWGEFAADDDD